MIHIFHRRMETLHSKKKKKEVMLFTVSVIFRVQVPVGFSPQVCTDMKAQFLKPLAEVSLSLSAKSTVVVPERTNTVFYTSRSM